MSFWNKLLGTKELPAEAVPEADKKALESAFYRREVEKAKALLKRGPALVHSQTEDGQTVLHLAAKVTNKDIAKLALARGINVNARDKWGDTPLHEAAKFADMSVLKLLLDNKADFNMKSVDGSTPLHCAAVNGHTSVVELLLAKGADVNAKNNAGAVHLCTWPFLQRCWIR
jgi:ankyrin repeat protein